MTHIDYGLGALRATALASVLGARRSTSPVYRDLARGARRVRGARALLRIGSPAGLGATRRLLEETASYARRHLDEANRV
jgi:hypothetical protein